MSRLNVDEFSTVPSQSIQICFDQFNLHTWLDLHKLKRLNLTPNALDYFLSKFNKLLGEENETILMDGRSEFEKKVLSKFHENFTNEFSLFQQLGAQISDLFLKRESDGLTGNLFFNDVHACFSFENTVNDKNSPDDVTTVLINWTVPKYLEKIFVAEIFEKQILTNENANAENWIEYGARDPGLTYVLLGAGNTRWFNIDQGTDWEISIKLKKYTWMNKTSNGNTQCGSNENDYKIPGLRASQAKARNGLSDGTVICTEKCVQKIVHEMCQLSANSSCQYLDEVYHMQNLQNTRLTLCSKYQLDKHFRCDITKLNATFDEIKNRYCQVTCQKPCVQWVFERSVTKFVPDTTPDGLNRIKIYYQNPLEILAIQEIPAYNWITLTGDVGGLFGLWLGGSMVSLLQMVYLMMKSHQLKKLLKLFHVKTIKTVKTVSC